MIICFPFCRKLIGMLKTCIKSIVQYNPEVEIFVFFQQPELSQNSAKDLLKIHKIIFVDFTNWMDVFDNCVKLKGQTNNYLRMLMPRFFKLYRPEIEQFIYCDEDCFCKGRIDNFWNLKFESDVIGFLDQSRCKRSFENHRDSFLLRRLEGYICSGLMKMKTSFNILKYSKVMNVSACLAVFEKYVSCDQLLFNMLEHDCIHPSFNPRSSSGLLASLSVVLNCLTYFNITHITDFKHNFKKYERIKRTFMNRYGSKYYKSLKEPKKLRIARVTPIKSRLVSDGMFFSEKPIESFFEIPKELEKETEERTKEKLEEGTEETQERTEEKLEGELQEELQEGLQESEEKLQELEEKLQELQESDQTQEERTDQKSEESSDESSPQNSSEDLLRSSLEKMMNEFKQDFEKLRNEIRELLDEFKLEI